METIDKTRLVELQGGNAKEFVDGVCGAAAVGGVLEAAAVISTTGGAGVAVYGACAVWGIARLFW